MCLHLCEVELVHAEDTRSRRTMRRNGRNKNSVRGRQSRRGKAFHAENKLVTIINALLVSRVEPLAVTERYFMWPCHTRPVLR